MSEIVSAVRAFNVHTYQPTPDGRCGWCLMDPEHRAEPWGLFLHGEGPEPDEYPDEPLHELLAAFEAGEKGVTARPGSPT